MFEVLVFVYENYVAAHQCPEPAHLERKLSAVGFAADEIEDALAWLQDLRLAAMDGSAPGTTPPDVLARADDKRSEGRTERMPETLPWLRQPSANSMRIYPAHEQAHLGAASLGFIRFMEHCGALSAHMREVVIDRAMAAPGGPVTLYDLKTIILMVYWSFGQEPDALILDELCDDSGARIAH